MPKLPARRGDQPCGWVNVPDDQNFNWFLRLHTTPKTSVTVPVRVLTQNRGWTQYFFADLTGLTQAQVNELVASNVLALQEAA